MAGILRILNDRDEAEKKAWQELERVCEDLRARIPPELRAFARGQDWAHKHERASELAYFLENMVRASRLPGGDHKVEVELRELKGYGFSSMDDCTTKLKLLEKAWSDVIRVTFTGKPGGGIVVHFTSSELSTPPQPVTGKAKEASAVT